MNLDRFLYCRSCNEIHHVTPFDKAPIYDLEDVTVWETPTDDRRSFLERHFEHRLEELTSLAEKHFYGQLIDPMKVGYLKVTNGQESLYLRISRRSIAEPVSYTIVPEEQVFLGNIQRRPGRPAETIK
jgi:hypothetical protein